MIYELGNVRLCHRHVHWPHGLYDRILAVGNQPGYLGRPLTPAHVRLRSLARVFPYIIDISTTVCGIRTSKFVGGVGERKKIVRAENTKLGNTWRFYYVLFYR